MIDSSSPEPPPPPSEHQKQTWKEAERVFDDANSGRRFHAESVDRYAILTIRSVQLSAAGGIIAALSFYGTHFDTLSKLPEKVQRIDQVLLALFLSLLVTMFAAGAGYFSQLYFSKTIDAKSYQYAFPYVSDTPASTRLSAIGSRWQLTAVSLMFAAGVFLVAGAVAGFLFLQ